jgi:DNA-binding IclR family transcriptional regulator
MKAGAVLRTFSHERPELTLQELKAATGLPLTTCQRIVANLVAEHLLDRVGDRYCVGYGIIELAAVASHGRPLARILQPIVRELRDRTQETACVFVPEGTMRVCIAVAPAANAVRVEAYVGRTAPLHLGATGKVLLAYDDDRLGLLLDRELERLTEHTMASHEALVAETRRIRRKGFAISSQESRVGLSGIAAPVFDANGSVVAAIALSLPTQRSSKQQLSRWAPIVIEMGQQASARLGHRPITDGGSGVAPSTR